LQKLTLDQLAIGRAKAFQNAADLIEDVDLLFRQRRWARVVFLSQIAIEELGKYLMIIGAIGQVLKNQMDWQSFWKRFKKHTEKTGNILTFDAFLSPFISDEDTLEKWQRVQRDEVELEKRKLSSLYVDFQSNQFVLPMDIIDEKLAKQAVNNAKAVFKFFAYGEEVFCKGDITNLTPEKCADVEKKLNNLLSEAGIPNVF